MSGDFLSSVLIFSGMSAFVGGVLVSGSLALGSLLLKEEHALAGRAVILLSLVLWVAAVLAIFLALGLWATG